MDNGIENKETESPFLMPVLSLAIFSLISIVGVGLLIGLGTCSGHQARARALEQQPIKLSGDRFELLPNKENNGWCVATPPGKITAKLMWGRENILLVYTHDVDPHHDNVEDRREDLLINPCPNKHEARILLRDWERISLSTEVDRSHRELTQKQGSLEN